MIVVLSFLNVHTEPKSVLKTKDIAFRFSLQKGNTLSLPAPKQLIIAFAKEECLQMADHRSGDPPDPPETRSEQHLCYASDAPSSPDQNTQSI